MLAAVLVIVLAGVAFYAALPTLAESIAERWLADNGAPDPDVEIAAIGLNGAQIASVSLDSANRGPDAHRIDVGYRLQGFGVPAVNRIVIGDLRMIVDPTDRDRPLGAVSDVIAALQRGGASENGVDDDEADPFARIPHVEIEAATIVMPTLLDGAEILLSGTIQPTADGQLTADLAFTGSAPSAHFSGALRIESDRNGTGTALLAIDEGSASYDGTHPFDVRSIAGTVDARFAEMTLAEASADLVLAGIESPGWPSADVTVVGTLADDAWSARIETKEPAAGLDGWVGIEGAVASDTPLTVTTNLTLDANAPWWELIGLPTPTDGSVSVVGEAIAPMTFAPANDTAPLPDLSGMLDVQATALDIPSIGSDLHLNGELDFASSGGGLSVSASSPIQVTGTPEPALLETLGLPIPASDQPIAVEFARLDVSSGDGTATDLVIDTALNVQLSGTPDADLASDLRIEIVDGGVAQIDARNIAMRGGAFDWEDGDTRLRLIGSNLAGDLEFGDDHCAGRFLLSSTFGSQTFAGIRSRAASFEIPLALECSADFITLTTTDRGTIAVSDLRIGGLEQAVENGRLTLAKGSTVSLPRRCAEPPCTGAILLSGSTGPLASTGADTFALDPASFRFEGTLTEDFVIDGALTFRSDHATMNSDDVVVNDLRVTATLRPGRPASISIRTGPLEGQTLADWVPVLTACFDGTLGPDAARFAGRIADDSGQIALDMDGTHLFRNSTGSATVEMQPIQFRPGGLQPWDIAPALAADIDEATGRISVGGNIEWRDGTVLSNISLRLLDVSLVTPDADIARLNGVVALKSLSPLATEPNQTVSAALIDIGIPLTDAVVTFAIEPGPRVAISDAYLTLAEGSVNAEPVTFDPFAPEAHVELAVENMDLAQFLALAAVDGLAASGLMKGRIPIDIRNNGISIVGGRLDATGPGLLKYAPTEPPAGLGSAGETAGMVLAALANFQYDTLWLTLDRAPGGEARLGLHVRGSNPDFFDGYPIELNLNLTGELDRILRDSLSGYSIPDIVRERLESNDSAAPSADTGTEETP